MPTSPDLLPGSDRRPFLDRLRAFGCTDVVDLSKAAASPAQLEYLDLLPKRGQPDPLPVPVAAVAEHQGTALLYLVDGHLVEPTARESMIYRLQHQLANRSDPAYLGVVTGGTLDVYPIEFHGQDNTKERRAGALHTVESEDRSAPLFFQSLVHGKFGELYKKPHGSDYVYKVIMDLLDGTTAQFGADPKKKVPSKLPPLEVLSLAGRALFFRFLVDRGIVLPEEAAVICPSAEELRRAFATVASAAEASAWLDKTFNGDFLPLIDEEEEIPSKNREARQAAYFAYYQKIHKITDGSIFIHLDAILRGWDSVDGKHVQPTLDFGLDWSDLSFAHIPVGVLSQVYENFSHRADEQFAKSTSVHYTPRTIARFLVDEAFESLDDPAHARVLDPACGAGIFLVLALRRLVKERWQLDGQPPNAETIRQILYRQLRGFDISQSALRLAALGLYITAIEVNQSPRPPKSLRFPRNLRDAVLFNFNEFDRQPGMQDRIPLGSLGRHVPGEKFDRQFHLVIGNPPWTALKAPTPIRTAEKAAQRRKLRSEGKVVEKEETTRLNESFTEIARRVLAERARLAREASFQDSAVELEDLAETYENPRKNPDLPFLWRATEWAVAGGTIALVLPARLYLLGSKTEAYASSDAEQEEAGQVGGTDHAAWRAVMQSLAITGIINGSDLRKSGVWRGVDVPFSIFFARNELPPPRHAFRFASPCFEVRQHEKGRFRLDYQNDVLVTYREVLAKPWLLKALAVGNSLDVDLIERLQAAFKDTLGGFWGKWDPRFLHTGEGYNLSPGLTQTPTDFLHRLPDFQEPDGWQIEFPLPTFEASHGRTTAHMPRRKELFEAPLLIVAMSPGQERRRPRAWISRQDVAFSKRWCGYSCAGHPEAAVLSSLLYLLPHSQIFLYYILLTSPRFGADRQTFNKGDLDSMPFPDPAELSREDKTLICELARLLEQGSEKPWKEIDAFFARLYGLSEADCELMEDTLFSAATYRQKGAAAFQPPQQDDVKVFTDCLQESLAPFLAVTGRTSEVRPADFPQDVYRDAWYFVEVTSGGQRVYVTPALLEHAIAIANDLGASRVAVRAEGHHSGLLLGQISQRRWWTKTRARLCAAHVIHNHLDALRPLRSSK